MPGIIGLVRKIAPLLFASSLLAAGYKGIYVGQAVADLPKSLHVFVLDLEGDYQGSWFRINVLNERVLGFDVIYSGKSLDRKTIIAQEMSLARAIKLHSLRAGMAVPQFGYAVNRDGQTYGLADVQNRIVYTVTPVATESMVEQVAYLSDDAPVFEWAKQHALNALNAAEFLGASRAASAVEPQRSLVDIEQSYKAASREGAVRKLQEQNDVVMGKEQRTLALIRDVTIWYEVDSNHQEALAKSKQLREFYASFHDEYRSLLRMYRANEGILRHGDVLFLEEAMKGSEEIESKMRRLKAMGFE